MSSPMGLQKPLNVCIRVSGLLLATACACVLVFVYRRRLPNTLHISAVGQPHVRTWSRYLLGDTEDSIRLWYPPELHRFDFQPSPLRQNRTPTWSVRLRTPLLVPFTRNNAMLAQTILSYIAAGWPREDIIVVDNSGTMDANPRRRLSSANPFHLDYHVLRTRYGVSVLQTPTLLTFSQLQNFLLRLALAHRWRFYFWSHMDVVVVSNESATPYVSFYQRVLLVLEELRVDSLDDITAPEVEQWALKFFAYDWLTLVNVTPWRTIGAWDTFIPYYASDCDAFSRVALHGFTKDTVRAGYIFDVSGVVNEPESILFPKPDEEDSLNSKRFHRLLNQMTALQQEKYATGRNTWQASSQGGTGEPWTYAPASFQKLWWDTAAFGRSVYKQKWGTDACELEDAGLTLDDTFRGMLG